jgi:hypothetical protein
MVVLAVSALGGCGTPDSSGDKDVGGILPDASIALHDAGSPHDAGATMDASSAQLDAGAPEDSGLAQADASQPDDASTVLPDAGFSQDAGAAQDAADCVPVSSLGPGGMDPGSNCVSCHGYLSVAGTVYSSASGGKPVIGATVRITGADGGVLELVTGVDGIFSSGQAVAFPAKVSVSKCPDTSMMTSTITSGECSATGCHDSSAPVRLP